MAALWGHVVGTRPASIDDEFMAVGGDLRGAARLLAGIRSRWRIDVTPQEFLGASSIAGLAATVERKLAEERTRHSDLLRSALAELEALGGQIPQID